MRIICRTARHHVTYLIILLTSLNAHGEKFCGIELSCSMDSGLSMVVGSPPSGHEHIWNNKNRMKSLYTLPPSCTLVKCTSTSVLQCCMSTKHFNLIFGSHALWAACKSIRVHGRAASFPKRVVYLNVV